MKILRTLGMVLIGRVICAAICAGLGSSVAAQNLRVELPRNAPKIASDFGSMKGVGGGRRSARHQGIDIRGKNRQPIIAVADGTVLDTEVGTCWGPTITVDHGRGHDGKPLIVLYGHLGDFAVRKGQRIARGQVVGTLGNNHKKYRCISGVRHLHLQIGRKARLSDRGSRWGHVRFLVDGKKGVNPHLYWAGGVGKPLCFTPSKTFQKGTMTYPLPC